MQTLGAKVNVGAGTITANYDGANKHQNSYGRRCLNWFELCAGCAGYVKAGATVGAGSTVSKDVDAETLTFTRAERTDIEGWPRPVKNKK